MRRTKGRMEGQRRTDGGEKDRTIARGTMRWMKERTSGRAGQ